jgi:hypothetical protein
MEFVFKVVEAEENEADAKSFQLSVGIEAAAGD